MTQQNRHDIAGAETPSAAPDEVANAPLDLDALVARCMGHFDLVERVLDNFEDQFLPDVHEIESALAASDSEQVARIAHRLKGTSASVSAEGLRHVMHMIEQSSREGHLDAIPDYLERLHEEWDKVSEHLASLSRPLHPGGA